MSLYESVIIVRQDASAQQVEALADNFEDTIKKNGGSVKKRENWGLRTLAYKIKKNRKGHYFLFNIDAPSAAIHEMERLMRLNEDIIRYLTLSIAELDEDPSIPAQNLTRIARSTDSHENTVTGGVIDPNNKEKVEGDVKIEPVVNEQGEIENKIEGED